MPDEQRVPEPAGEVSAEDASLSCGGAARRPTLVSAGSQTDRSPPSSSVNRLFSQRHNNHQQDDGGVRHRLSAPQDDDDDEESDNTAAADNSTSSVSGDVTPASAGERASSALSQLLSGWVCVRRGADKSTQTRRDPLQTDAERLALDVVYYVLGRHTQPPKDQLTRTLRLATDEILTKHKILLSGMVARLEIRPDSCYETFVSVADELFDGGHVTWARIVTFYAFGARLALYCNEKDMAEFVPEIAHFLGVYATEHLTPFVREQGGWSVMCEHFQYPESMEGKVWKALLKLGIGLGIAATATLITTSSR